MPAPKPAATPAPVPVQRHAAPETLTPFVPTLTNAAINSERASRGLTPKPSAPDPLSSSESRANWPLIGDDDDEETPSKRVTPPWQADDLVMPSLRLVEPPSPRLVEPPSPTSTPLRLVDDPLTSPSALHEPTRSDRHSPTIPKPRRTERPTPAAEDDDDLLIFASVSSAWFGGEPDNETTWNSAMDVGWRAAEEASLRPSIAGDTRAGLPQRVPHANLVPGAPVTPQQRPLRIVRDADEIAANTSSYFRGWRRGSQEAGGYAVGGRPGRESASGWDFNRDHDEREDYGRRTANYR
jgi:hypothetical protein